MNLPKLVQDKINNYYIQHRIRAKREINQEYKEKVTIYEAYSNTQLSWNHKQTIFVLKIRGNCDIFYETRIKSWKKGMYQFNNQPSSVRCYVYKPKNYYFSSGLNQNLAYKESDYRKTFFYASFNYIVHGFFDETDNNR